MDKVIGVHLKGNENQQKTQRQTKGILNTMKNTILNNILKTAIKGRLEGGLSIDKSVGYALSEAGLSGAEKEKYRKSLLGAYKLFKETALEFDIDFVSVVEPELPVGLKGRDIITIISDTPYPEEPSLPCIANIFDIDEDLIEETEDNQVVVIKGASTEGFLNRLIKELDIYALEGLERGDVTDPRGRVYQSVKLTISYA